MKKIILIFILVLLVLVVSRKLFNDYSLNKEIEMREEYASIHEKKIAAVKAKFEKELTEKVRQEGYEGYIEGIANFIDSRMNIKNAEKYLIWNSDDDIYEWICTGIDEYYVVYKYTGEHKIFALEAQESRIYKPKSVLYDRFFEFTGTEELVFGDGKSVEVVVLKSVK
ncbi:MAG: hypothetical protein GY714_07650 [Desulfobacterales bacterium]|nr:hypothetical protein [Desulfobacterales bacterium]